MISLLDTHAHLDAPELSGVGFELIAPAAAQGVETFIVPGVRVSGWKPLLRQLEQYPQVYAAPGLHPVYAEQWSPAVREELSSLVRQAKVVAIGEIGLDAVNGPPLGLQEQVLREQLQIALEAGLPVLLHGRKTTGRLLAILQELEIGRRIGGIWHGFSGSLQVAQQLLSLGFKIGVGPILLRESARKLPQAVKELPCAAFVLETDLPDMADTPETLLAVAVKMAELRGTTLEEIAQITTENACELFRF